MEKQGVFYAVSVGPGDPEPLTRQACRVLEACDVIAAPRMKSGRMLALDIAAGAVDMQGKTVLPLDFTMAHDAAVREDSYRTAAAAIEAELAAGRGGGLGDLGGGAGVAPARHNLEGIRAGGVVKGVGARATPVSARGARGWGGPSKTVLPLDFTMERSEAVREDSYRMAAAAIEAELSAGRDVAMVNLGDVSVYATAYYILERIRADGFETVMCPGVTSFCAVAARLGRSLTRMEEPLHILPGSTDLDNALALPGTKVVMKSGKAIYKAAAALERHGLLANAGMVADCGLETEQVYTDLRQLPEEISYFATIVAD